MFREEEYEPLLGILEGELIFKESEIVIDKKTIRTIDIKRIVIFGWDFTGTDRVVYPNTIHSYNGNKSQGIRNVLKIDLADGTKRILNFKVIKDNNIENLRALLKNYARQGIMSYDDLIIALDHYHLKMERPK